MSRFAKASDLDFASLLRPGDRIVVGQATSEPTTLTGRLVETSGLPPGCRVFLGPLYSDTFLDRPELPFVLEAYGAIGNGVALSRQGRLDILPMHYSALAPAYREGVLGADCVLVQLAPDGEGFNLGLCNDHLVDAARRARLVIAEVNPHAPVCAGGEWPREIEIHMLVDAERRPLEMRTGDPAAIETAIAGHVASLVPDRAVLQFGVGAIPQAVTGGLVGHRDLGVHSGALFDGVVDLVEGGAVTNAAKEADAGVSIAGLLIGSRRLYDFAHRNPRIRLAPPSVTHGLGSIARLSRFCAINSAIEVDLTGQVNAEVAGGAYVGGVGGQADFVRGANASPGGRAIIALPASARNGTVSRIVARARTATSTRADADAIVTEFGVAELRGLTLSQRAARMISIAAPQFREDLARQWHDVWRERNG